MVVKLNLIKTADVLDGVNSFVGVVKFTDIWDHCLIPIYKPGDNADNIIASYQREPEPSRVKAVRDRFLKDRDKKDKRDIVDIQALIDNVNLNIRHPDISISYVKPVNMGNDEVGDFYVFDYIPELIGKIYVVDGQTRMKGLGAAIEFAKIHDVHRFNLLKDLRINYTITFTSNLSDEAFIFYLLNKYSKPLKTDGVQRILYSGFKEGNDRFEEEIFKTGNLKHIESYEIADNLNQNEKSVWFGKIFDYNEKGVIAQSSMAVKVIYPLYQYISKKSSEAVSSKRTPLKITEEYLNAFWSAIEDIFPECFRDNPEKYNILSSNSAVVMTGFMVKILEKINDNPKFEGQKFSPVSRDRWIEKLKEPLKNYKEYNQETELPIVGSNNWMKGGPVGNAGNDGARNKLVERLFQAYRVHHLGM